MALPTYRARLIIERVEIRRPMIRGAEVPKEATYDEVRIEVTCTDSDVALSKIIGLAQAEQTDRDLRSTVAGNQNNPPSACPGVPHRGHTKAENACPFDEDEDEPEDDA